MAEQTIVIGRTGSYEYLLRRAWVYRRRGGIVQRYDTLPGFVEELMAGACGPSWRETPEGTAIIDRFVS
jgi:hypothetical protein